MHDSWFVVKLWFCVCSFWYQSLILGCEKKNYPCVYPFASYKHDSRCAAHSQLNPEVVWWCILSCLYTEKEREGERDIHIGIHIEWCFSETYPPVPIKHSNGNWLLWQIKMHLQILDLPLLRWVPRDQLLRALHVIPQHMFLLILLFTVCCWAQGLRSCSFIVVSWNIICFRHGDWWYKSYIIRLSLESDFTRLSWFFGSYPRVNGSQAISWLMTHNHPN